MLRNLTCIALVLSAFLPAAQAQGLTGFDCLIEPNSIIELGTSESGLLGEIVVDRGDHIEEGQVLARLASSVEKLAVELAKARAEAQAKLESSRQNVSYLGRQLERIDDLVSKQAMPAQEKDRAETELALARYQLQELGENQHIAELEYERASEALERRTIRSPINGVVMELLLSPGELVENRPIIKVAEIVPLSVEVIMPVENYASIEVGMKAEVTPRIPQAITRVATVVAVDAVVDAASNTFGVGLELPNQDRSIPGGVRCDVRFLANQAGTDAQAGSN